MSKATPKGSKTSQKEELVLTPGGWRPKSKVHLVEPGHHISGEGGRLKIIHTESGKTIKDLGILPKAPSAKKGKPVMRVKPASKKKGAPPTSPITDTWIVNSEWTNNTGNPISYFKTRWTVPPEPATDNDQIVYLFNGLCQTSTGPFILQPVLQWGSYEGGGKYWSVANWYVDGPGGIALHGPHVKVNPGDVLEGIMTLTGQTGTNFNYLSSFTGHSTADLTVNNIAELAWANETLECYSFKQFSDYPDTGLTAFHDIEIRLRTSTTPFTEVQATINWQAHNRVTDNGQHCLIVSNDSPGGDVYLYYRSVTQDMYFVNDKSTFGKDEVTDVIADSGGTFSNAFWVVLEGYTIDQLSIDQLSPLTPILSGAFSTIPGVTITPNNSGPEYELPSDLYTPQRIRFPFDIHFTAVALTSFPSPGDAQANKVLNSAITIGAVYLSAITLFALVAGADPYFTNIDPSQDNVFWLSQDLRVFSAAVGDTPLPGGLAFTSDPYQSIQNLLSFLNSNAAYTTPGPDPLNALPGQTGYETGDSSVTPLNLSGQKNFNFAIARVRLQDAAGSAANNVRVFFRLFVAQSCDTDFQPATTYKSQQGTSGADAGKPISPLPSGSGLADPEGQSIQTVPFFATDANGTHDYDGMNANANIRPIQIPSGQDKVWAYFGCFLDVYDSSNQCIFAGTHHCIVAEIAYDDAPIQNSDGVTMSPENSDKLAQRNLQITSSGNPRYPDTHRIPQAFDLRASLPISIEAGSLLNYPDELMIDWGNVPAGSVANIYWPQVSAQEVLNLAAKLYGIHPLTTSDANTIKCKITKGVTYIPIPQGTGKNFAGLFTVDLPNTLHVGQEFNIKVRRISSRQYRTKPVERTFLDAAAISKKRTVMRNWRYVTGTFQIKIPVGSEQTLLLPEENTLAILKWRLQHMSPAYRWYPVLQRYISYVTGRVKGFGGKPGAIEPGLGGIIVRGKEHGEERIGYTGKVSAIVYDRFGDFEGFFLDTEDGERTFRSTEHEIEALAQRAWAERILITVFAERHEPHRPMSIVFRRAPRPFQC